MRADEAGVFGGRQVELVHGEVRLLVRRHWLGTVASNVGGLLRVAYAGTAYRETQETLVLAHDAIDPDCRVRPRHAAGEALGPVLRLPQHTALLAVEVGDATAADDLDGMAQIYAAAGIPTYWVVTRRGIYVHTGPTEDGYADRHLHGASELVAVPGPTCSWPTANCWTPSSPTFRGTLRVQPAGWPMKGSRLSSASSQPRPPRGCREGRSQRPRPPPRATAGTVRRSRRRQRSARRFRAVLRRTAQPRRSRLRR